jgi:cytochrome c553
MVKISLPTLEFSNRPAQENRMKHLWLTIASTLMAGHAMAIELSAADLVAQRCSTCHGAQGQSSSPIFPSLAAQNPQYLVKQLNDFKAKKRVSDSMAPQVADLSDDNIAELAAFFAAKPAKVNRVSEVDLLPVGSYIYTKGNSWSGLPACANCHGDKAQGTVTLPRLAGQNARYLMSQLKDFNQRARTNDNAAMRLVASRLTEMESKTVADYLSQLP